MTIRAEGYNGLASRVRTRCGKQASAGKNQEAKQAGTASKFQTKLSVHSGFSRSLLLAWARSIRAFGPVVNPNNTRLLKLGKGRFCLRLELAPKVQGHGTFKGLFTPGLVL